MAARPSKAGLSPGEELPTSLPAEVASLIADHIDSVLRLELLLLFYGDPARVWTAAQAAGALGIAAEWADRQATDLERRGLLERTEEGWRFGNAAAGPKAAVEALAHEYVRRRVAVVSAIYARRQGPLQSFADAFRLRPKDDAKEKPDG
jgi:hypothetical protein